jgi:hypothetical protein
LTLATEAAPAPRLMRCYCGKAAPSDPRDELFRPGRYESGDPALLAEWRAWHKASSAAYRDVERRMPGRLGPVGEGSAEARGAIRLLCEALTLTATEDEYYCGHSGWDTSGT